MQKERRLTFVPSRLLLRSFLAAAFADEVMKQLCFQAFLHAPCCQPSEISARREFLPSRNNLCKLSFDLHV